MLWFHLHLTMVTINVNELVIKKTTKTGDVIRSTNKQLSGLVFEHTNPVDSKN